MRLLPICPYWWQIKVSGKKKQAMQMAGVIDIFEIPHLNVAPCSHGGCSVVADNTLDSATKPLKH